ncbi:head maturation protease, ClpP-related [Paracoccus sp. MC1862]|uniref:head maturation protease, ClpP-related n=1 Tax=Paracoccus sp. MC1862 TaxID=2760307 RepID=UPI001602C5EC|nr:head maturation protease, ClpP-related [Paracoccus sp. MC1862]MBB1498108.1 Clp protease ClpP [Paracoccus sp. MC1862]QQO46210.1 Clp protease ClpP [Paracoccus sp. MC1862]
MASWYSIRARATGTEVAIYDEIGAYGVSAKGFLAELGALPEGRPVDLRLNSPGGSVFDAVAIHNALKRHAGSVTVWIDGIAASAASYVAMAGDEIVMPENAFLMIHDPAGLVMGTAEDMRAMAEALDKVGGSLAAGYAAKSGRSIDEIAALMAAETWLDASEALSLGFADRLVEPVRIAARFDVARFRNAPPALAEAIAAGTDNDDTNGAGTDAGEAAESDEASGAGEERIAGTNARQPPADTPPPGGAPLDPAAIRAEAIAHARTVVDLCRLAGQPQMAGRFLESDADLGNVRAALLAAKAEAEPEIAGHHAQPGRPSSTRPWGEIVARTFRPKG